MNFQVNRLAVIAAMAILVSGCTSPGTSSPLRPETRTITAPPAYPIDSSPAMAVGFFMNENVFAGTVIRVLPDVVAIDVMDSGIQFEAVYTPVVLRVDRSFDNSLEPGTEVTIRAWGGEAEGIRYVAEMSPDKTALEVGNTLIIFGGEFSAITSEAAPVLNPNFIYAKQGNEYVDVTYTGVGVNGEPLSRVNAAEFTELVAQSAVED